MRQDLFVTFFCLAVMTSQTAAVPAADRPNIVFFFADDLGYGELGCYGQKKILTPNIDRMAAEGMRFTQFYSGNAVCAPSRCCLMTGRHSGHAFVRNNIPVQPEGQVPIPAEAVTVAELLKARGYATAAMGKWGLGPMYSTGDVLSQGFDHFFGYACQSKAHHYYPTQIWIDHEHVTLAGNSNAEKGEHFVPDMYADAALKFIADNRNRPFFLYYPTIVPHVALQVPEDSLAPYTGKWEDPPYDGSKGYLPHPTPRAAYAAMVSRMDRDVGRLLEQLKMLGLDDNTIFVFTSDNGPTHNRVGGSDSEFFESTAGRRGLKGSLYEGGIQVPAIVRWPGKIPAGIVSDHVSANYDWLPTLLELTGTPAENLPASVDGISFVPTLLNQPSKQKQHDFLYWEFPAYGGQQALRMGNWKLVRQNLVPPAKKGVKSPVPTLELFDLSSDQQEAHDVAKDHPEVVTKMQAILQREHTNSEVFPFPVLDREASEK